MQVHLSDHEKAGIEAQPRSLDLIRDALEETKESIFLDYAFKPEMRPAKFLVAIKDGGPMQVDQVNKQLSGKPSPRLVYVKLRDGNWLDMMLDTKNSMTGYAYHDNGDFAGSA